MKVILVGPQKSGKSLLANILADKSVNFGSHKYTPTSGVRILTTNHDNVNATIWDVSGGKFRGLSYV